VRFERGEHVPSLLTSFLGNLGPYLQNVRGDIGRIDLQQVAGARAQHRREFPQPPVRQSTIAGFEKADHGARRFDRLRQLRLGHPPVLTPRAEEVFLWCPDHERSMQKRWRERIAHYANIFSLHDYCRAQSLRMADQHPAHDQACQPRPG